MKNCVFGLIKNTAEKLAGQSQCTILHNQEAQWLVEKALKPWFGNIYLAQDTELTENQTAAINNLIQRRLSGEPLDYIIGSVPFCDLEILVKTPTLIPRIETDEWCSKLIKTLSDKKNKNLKILDLCSGSGCISLAMANEFKNSSVIGLDIEPEAISLAKKNQDALKIKNVSFIWANLFDRPFAEEKFDLIISNPPYLSVNEWNELSPSVKDWEDKKALVGGDNGLEFYEFIAKESHSMLSKENGLGWLVLEIGHAQSEAVKKILEKNDYSVFNLFVDSFGHDRAIFSTI